IHDVIQNTVLLSWFSSLPANFGHPSAGTIKADEWQMLITVHIPLALISLWGAPDVDELKLGNKANAYCSYIAHYVGNLKQVHPTFNLHPNHHAAFHIYDYLILFGPVHSWWTFPFKCLISVLQHLPTNHKSSELEATMLHSYLRGAHLHSWLSHPDCPNAVQECKVLLD
ncbi:hypothetical protein M404DRAFT_107108, partial [Pisolithus tinctorius Marx 270]